MIVVSDSMPLRYLVFIELEHVLPRHGEIFRRTSGWSQLFHAEFPSSGPFHGNLAHSRGAGR